MNIKVWPSQTCASITQHMLFFFPPIYNRHVLRNMHYIIKNHKRVSESRRSSGPKGVPDQFNEISSADQRQNLIKNPAW